MVGAARAQVPDASFVHADVRHWTCAEASWDGVCAFFPFLQMSRVETAGVLADIARWLVPGGLLALVTVPLDAEGLSTEFLGHPVRITSFTPGALGDLVRTSGLEIVDTRLEVFQPDKPDAPAEEHLLILARRPA